jgi:hypothetical protein
VLTLELLVLPQHRRERCVGRRHVPLGRVSRWTHP